MGAHASAADDPAKRPPPASSADKQPEAGKAKGATEEVTLRLEKESADIRRQMKDRTAKLDALIAQDAQNVSLCSERGDARLFADDFRGAREDFEKMIALDATQDAPHWRLGIVYFLLGEYALGARQFEKYHAYDDHDRENGVWHYFCLAKSIGIQPARAKMLEYTKFDRHPFPSLYSMHAGKLGRDAVLKEIEDAEAGADEKERRRFFAELYVGFDFWLDGKQAQAVEHLQRSVDNRYGREISNRTYMWQVARVLWEHWRKTPKPAKP